MCASLLSRFWRPLLCLLIGGIAYALYVCWPQLLFQIIQWQIGFQRELGLLLRTAARSGGDTTLALVGASFAYGVFHAAGPGHGKLVISTYLATQPGRIRQALQLSVLASLLQAAVAIGLIGVASWLFGLTARQAQGASVWFERGSFLLVAMMGGYLAWRAATQIWRLQQQARRQRPQPFTVRGLRPLTTGGALATPVGLQPLAPHSMHDAACGCGHQHVPDQAALEQADNWQSQFAIVLSMGLRPCSGALLILVLARVMNQFGLGMLATLAMAAGTALTVSLLALISQRARQLAYRLLQQQPGRHSHQLAIAMQGLALAGGVVLTLAGLLLMSAPTSVLMPR